MSGYTIIARPDKHLNQHEHEFESKADLMSFLAPHFRNVSVFETVHPSRHNLYFYAGDGAVPFDHDWEGMLKSRR